MRTYLPALVVLLLLALIMGTEPDADFWGQAGKINFGLGMLLLLAFLTARILVPLNFPKITGYIFAGILAGPFVLGFFSQADVTRMHLINDLALSFIGLSAGAELKTKMLQKRFRAISLNILCQTLVLFAAVFVFIKISATAFSFTRALSHGQVTVMALLLGVLAVARSPSSAIAIVSETRSKGPFTDVVLGVTVATDVLIIILFTGAMALAKTFLPPVAGGHGGTLGSLLLEMGASLVLGAVLGRLISAFMSGGGRDLGLFLLFFAFAVAKASQWVGLYMEARFHMALHLEPLLICMTSGFVVQNMGKHGSWFVQTLDRFSLPVYVLFFSLAGATLNLEALVLTWPLALCLALIRGAGLFASTWWAGKWSAQPVSHRRVSWMAYLAQAGVAIGLAQLASSQFPEMGQYLLTVVLAVIFINQVVGPVAFKVALAKVGEAGKRGRIINTGESGPES